MDEEVKKLKELIEASGKILITSHISPDPDAITSILLTYKTLRKNFPGKEIIMALEEEPLGLSFLSDYDKIKFNPMPAVLAQMHPDLLIILDGNNYNRASRLHGDDIREFITRSNIKTAVIDHHEPAGKDETDVYINRGSPATVQDVYEICFNGMELQKPDGFADITMLGLYSDTGGFAYANKRHTETFKLADELISAGANIEEINNLTNQYTDNDMLVFAELAKNAGHQDDYSYSFIRDEFVSDWLKNGLSATELHKGTEAFVNGFIRNIGGRKWGYITYKNTLGGDNNYSVSLRAVGTTKDVSEIARKLGGGGHKPAAGAKFEANSIEEALDKIKTAISEV